MINRKTAIILLMTCIMYINGFPQQKILNYYEQFIPQFIDPVYGKQYMIGRRAASLVYTYLYGRNKVREFIPLMAEGKPNTVKGNKNLYSVSIKPGLQWHDNEELTARDIAKTFKVLQHRNTKYSGKEMLENISTIQSDGKYGILIKSPQNIKNIEYYLVFPVLPSKYLNSPFLEKSSRYNRKPVGNGPYKIVEKTNDKIIFEKFGNYTPLKGDSPPEIEKVVLEQRYDRSVWVNDLLSGRVDVLIEVPLRSVSRIEEIGRADVAEYPSYSMDMLAFNMASNPLLKYKFIRTAICHGFDRKRIISAQYANRANIVTGPYPFGSFYYWSEVQNDQYKYDQEKARKLLEAAGCRKKDDGYYYYNGNKLSFGVIATREQTRSQILTSFKKDMKEIGIEITDLSMMDFEIYKDRLVNKKYDIAWVTPNFNENLDISSLYASNGNQNYWGYKNSTVDNYFEKIRNTTDSQLELAYGHQIHKTIHEDAPCFFLWTKERYAGYNSQMISIFDPHPLDFFSTIEEWQLRD